MDGAVTLVDADIARAGRADGLLEQLERFLVVADDVDLLAAQFLDDVADAGAAGADAGPDGIDLGVARIDGDLGAVTRVAGHLGDGDGLVGDLGDLELEEAADEAVVGAGEHELAAALRVLADLEQQAADAVAGAELIPVTALLVREHGLGGAELDDDVAALGAADGAGDDVADLVLVFLEDLVLLDLAEALVEELLRRLGGDAAEVGHVDRLADLVPHGGARPQEAGGHGVHLAQRVRDRVGHGVEDVGLELAGRGVGRDLDVLAGHDRLLDGGLDGLDDEGAGLVLGDALLFLEVLEVGFDVDAHGCAVGAVKVLGTKKAGPAGPTSVKVTESHCGTSGPGVKAAPGFRLPPAAGSGRWGHG